MTVNDFSGGDRAGSLPYDLASHRGFGRVFRPGKLTLGLIAPLEGYPDSPAPTLDNHVEMVRKADENGIAALWLRDVPFYDPGFGDVGQIIDPMVYAGFLAAHTRQIAIGSAGIVLPLRDPLIVAKQSTSVDQLLGGRFILGLSGGDRAEEFPAFGVSFDDRAERYRDAYAIIRAAVGNEFPTWQSEFYGELRGTLDLIPKPVGPGFPAVAIGRSGQTLDWLAANMDAWIWHGADARHMADILPKWRQATADKPFKPYGYGTWFDLAEDPDLPIQPGRILKGGRHALTALWREQEEAGVNHVVLNMKQTRRPVTEILDELAEFILPQFPTHTVEMSS